MTFCHFTLLHWTALSALHSSSPLRSSRRTDHCTAGRWEADTLQRRALHAARSTYIAAHYTLHGAAHCTARSPPSPASPILHCCPMYSRSHSACTESDELSHLRVVTSQLAPCGDLVSDLTDIQRRRAMHHVIQVGQLIFIFGAQSVSTPALLVVQCLSSLSLRAGH